MEPKSSSIDTLRTTIQQLIDEKKSKLTASGGSRSGSQSEIVLHGDSEILSELLSQLEMLKGQDKIKQSLAEGEDVHSCIINEDKVERNKEIECQDEALGTKEIVKELKNVKRQNTITHWLLSGLILVTVVWQLSEYSLMLKMKEGFSHPIKSFGGILQGMMKRAPKKDEDEEKQNFLPSVENLIETSFSPTHIPHMDLPGTSSGELE